MWPQKWKASARWARNAAASVPPPLTASRSRPIRARNPRREVASTTAPLRPRSSMREFELVPLGSRQESLELQQRVEGPLRAHGAADVEHDAVGTPGDL